MAEFSLFWTTGETGDGASPYTMAQLTDWLRRTFTPGQATGGVIKGHGDELVVSAASGSVNVAAGAAAAYGYPYENDAAANVAIPTPASGTRIDRIVLRVDWVAQTVRITRIPGNIGAGAPVLTQTPGTTYDIPLAQVAITAGGAITVTDERVFCVFGTQVLTDNLADGAVTAAKIDGGAVGTEMIADGAVTAAKLGAKAVKTAALDDAAVTAAKTDAVSAATAGRLMVRDAAGRAQVAAPAVDADIVRLDSIKDLRQSTSMQADNATNINESFTDVSQMSRTITLARTCDLHIYFTGQIDQSDGSTPVSYYAQVDQIDMETYRCQPQHQIYQVAHGHWYFGGVGAGQHTIKIRAKRESGALKAFSARRLTVLAVPKP